MVIISFSKLASYFHGAGRIVFFTGEGLGREIGINDFRSDFGPWGKVRPSNIFTAQSLKKDPTEFYKFCLKHLYNYRDTEPGEAHFAIAQMEETLSEKKITVITQNVDGLHQKAGSSKVVELHGNLKKLKCTYCFQKYSSDYLDAAPGVPKCSCGKTLRPDMVLFYEDIPLETFFVALEEIKQADLVVVVGSSLRVFPANTLLKERKKTVPLVMINNQPTDFDRMANLIIHKKAGPTLRGALRHMIIKAI